jgi:cyanobactin maturation PatA/PatG family protease
MAGIRPTPGIQESWNQSTVSLHPDKGDAPIPDVEALWAETRGDARVAVAILDGPVDGSHPSLRGANLRRLEGLVADACDTGPACRHGTHVASVILGQHDGPVKGMAPGCRGLLLPIFASVDAHAFQPCSQLDLARAITRAALSGAQVINVSGGQFSPSGTAHPLLMDVVRDCARRGILIVAAAGNEADECLHVPAALDSVLAVGALNARGEPLHGSACGGRSHTQTVLAPGEDILGARPGGGTQRATGSSFAAALVSGAAALLLSVQAKRGQRPDPRLVREAILRGAQGRSSPAPADGQRFCAGRLSVAGALSFLTQGRCTMAEPSEDPANSLSENHAYSATATPSLPAQARLPEPAERSPAPPAERPQAAARPVEAPATSCGCKGAAAAPQLVYALGQIGYDFPQEARLDSIVQKMAAQAGISPPERGLAYDPRRLLDYLDQNPWDAGAIEWTLSLDGATLYAIRPQGPFAAEGYRELRRFLKERLEEGVERVSVPGVLAGQAVLLTGQVVPVIVPELRGMYSWTTAALVDAVVGPAPAADGPAHERDGHERKRAGLRNFLHRVYHEVRNLGLTPQDRALNFAATNAFEMGEIFTAAVRGKMELDRTGVAPSPVGRPGSSCWDVEVYFFYPERQVQTVRKVYRFTVDVSDNVPVTVGTMRSWFTR